MPDVQVQRLPHGVGLPLPAYETAGAAGMDVPSAIDLTLSPGRRAAIPTGLALAIPAGYEMQVRARSGLALREGLGVLNAPGTIDSDYRGEVKIILVNLGERPVHIQRGMRIAQLVLAPVAQLTWQEVASLPDSQRGSGGFGSTGRH